MARYSRSSRRWRDRLPGRRPETLFHWRGKGVSRLENLADAVFGFAITLLVVTTNVPESFDGLVKVLRGFPAFVACFALLMLFWNAHYKFFRRYGLEDFVTRSLNYIILLLIIFSVYPLKILFMSWLGGGDGIGPSNIRFVYRVYGLGLGGIWALYACLFWYALRQRDALALSAIEIEYTKLEASGCMVNVATCALSIFLSYLPVPIWLPGVIYATLGITMAANGFYFGRRINRLSSTRPSISEPSTAIA